MTPEQLMKKCQIGCHKLDDANDLLAECYGAIGRLAAVGHKCEWKFDYDGYFHTGCDYDYALVDGTLEDNSHNFCPKCGGRIVEI